MLWGRYGLHTCKGREWLRTTTASLFGDAHSTLVVGNPGRFRCDVPQYFFTVYEDTKLIANKG